MVCKQWSGAGPALDGLASALYPPALKMGWQPVPVLQGGTNKPAGLVLCHARRQAVAAGRRRVVATGMLLLSNMSAA